MTKLFILLVIVVFAAPAPAEIYKYVDQQGEVHFTDDINQVPLDQRDSFEVSSEYVPDPAAEENYSETQAEGFTDDEKTDPELESSYEVDPEATQSIDDDSGNLGNRAQAEAEDSLNQSDNGPLELDAGRNRLETLKKEIDKEYAELVKDKEKLAEEQKKLTTREDVLKFNAKVENLNKRAEAYVKKGKQYQAQVEAYNQLVIQRNAQLSQKKESP